MTNAQDTLENRLEHAQILVDTFLSAEMNEKMTPRLTDGLLYSLRELLEQAQAAALAMRDESKPDAPVMMDGEPIRNLEKELISVLREVVDHIGLAESRGSYLLDHIDESRPKPDKAA